MSAKDVGGTRLDEAKDVASEIVRSLDGRQRVAVASVAGDVDYRAHFSTNEEYAKALANYAELVENFTELRAARFASD